MQKIKGERMKKLKKHAGHAFSQFRLTNNLLNNLSQFDVTPTAKLVLLYLSGCYNPVKADVFPRQKTIADKTGISERSVIRAVQELVKAGLIIVECKSSNRYKFTSKIVQKSPQDLKNFEPENLSDYKSQNDILDMTKSHNTCIEPKKEQKINPEDRKYLIEYAKSKNVQNKNAYINAIIRNGGAAQIIKEYKQIEARKIFYENENKRVQREMKESLENCVKNVPKSYWDDVRKIISGQKKALQ